MMKRRNLVALVAAGALVLAACGGDDDDDAAADEPAEPAEEPADDASSETTEAMDEPSEEPAGDMEIPEDWPDSLVFTLTPSQEAGGLIETAEPLGAMLSERLGGIEVEALVPSDYAGVIVALQSGQAQIAGGLGAAQMPQAEDQAGADLILQSVRFGNNQYVTQWFTNNPDEFCADEPVQVVDEEDGSIMTFCNGVDQATAPTEGPIGSDQLPNVAGKVVAMVDQGSASGYLIPSLGLLDAGVDPIEDVEVIFAGGHPNAVQAVYDGDAEVGVSFNDARTGMVEELPDVGEKVVVFGWSAPIPNDGFAVAGDLPDDLKTAITEAFIDIAATEAGAELLFNLYEIDGLVPVPAGSYDIMRQLETELSDLLE